ncbi:MAG: LysM peptidoglycan-binding domain-containing protein [Pseudomonadales bacterium]
MLLILAGCQMLPQTGSDTGVAKSSGAPALPVQLVEIPRIPHKALEPAADADLWEQIRSRFELDHALDRRRVQQQLRWLQANPHYLPRLQDRLQRYLPHIHAELVARDLPGELALLPIVESALDPYAFSHGGAAGLWQFMPVTASRFGLPRNWWVDARRDPVLATTAALDYLEYLHGYLQDWHLALAGYNAGEGRVRRAVRQSSGGSAFWDLRLPSETSAYVPRLLALAAVVADPAAYGLELPPLEPEPTFVTIATHGQFDLIRAAAALGIEVDALYEWNPALNQWATPPQGPHHLHVPVALADHAQQSISAVPEQERLQWLRIKVADGDTLSHIARRHKTDVATLRSINSLSSNRIRAGQALVVPRTAARVAAGPASRPRPSVEYRVKSGDSLWAIARAHRVSVDALARENQIGPREVLRVGSRLTIPRAAPGAGTAAAVSGQPPHATRDVVRRVNYGVRRGDSLAKIASRFNVAIGDIAAWNELDVKNYLQPGQKLLIYVNVAAAE